MLLQSPTGNALHLATEPQLGFETSLTLRKDHESQQVGVLIWLQFHLAKSSRRCGVISDRTQLVQLLNSVVRLPAFILSPKHPGGIDSVQRLPS